MVVLFRGVFAACGAAPFVIDTGLHLRPVDAMFESVSGITTSGATVLLCFTGLDPLTAFGTTAGCINNMGIGYGETGGGFGRINDAAKWIMSAAMIWSRLEVLSVLVILSRSYWRY